MLSEDEGKLSALSDRWKELEERIKAAEQITGAVCIPAINELRYSGRRFFEAWRLAAAGNHDAGKREALDAHFLMAEQYFNNADHDLVDSLISFYDERRRQFLDKYGISKASAIYARFVVWLDLISDAQDTIRKSRSERENRLSHYSKITNEILPLLETHYRAIVRDEILFVRKEKFNGFVRLILGIAGLVGWIAGLLCLVAEWDKIKPIIGSAWGSVFHQL